MQAVLHNLAIALITFHVVGGCYLHHAHAWDRQHALDMELGVATHCVPHEHPCSHCPNAPAHPTNPCQEGTCQFVAPEKTRLSEPPLWLTAVSILGIGSPQSAAACLAGSDVVAAADCHAWHGLRLHLVHQVFLL